MGNCLLTLTLIFSSMIFFSFSSEELHLDSFDFFSLYLLFDSKKIYIDPQIQHMKLDIGLSYNAPISQQWLV